MTTTATPANPTRRPKAPKCPTCRATTYRWAADDYVCPNCTRFIPVRRDPPPAAPAALRAA
jgi:tRNA(Ile2) C34 agmatinyltransferase TiaS